MQHDVTSCINEALKMLNELLPQPIVLDRKDSCVLYGENGLDSISLVLLISVLEKNIEDEFGVSVTLADEKAMSLRNSPFLNVGRLTHYIKSLLEEKTS